MEYNCTMCIGDVFQGQSGERRRVRIFRSDTKCGWVDSGLVVVLTSLYSTVCIQIIDKTFFGLLGSPRTCRLGLSSINGDRFQNKLVSSSLLGLVNTLGMLPRGSTFPTLRSEQCVCDEAKDGQTNVP
jgi:hypothetical protein